MTCANLAGLHLARGELAEAAELYARARAIQERNFGQHPSLAVTLNHQADLEAAAGRLAEAEAGYRRAAEIQQKTLPPGHPSLTLTRTDLADLLVRQGRPEEAEPLIAGALESAEAWLRTKPRSAAGKVRLAAIHRVRGDLLAARGEREAAEEAWRRVIELLPPAGDPDLVHHLHLRAVALLRLGRAQEAKGILEQLHRAGWRHRDLPGAPVDGPPADR